MTTTNTADAPVTTHQPSSKFPIDLSALKPLQLDPASPTLTPEQRETLKHISALLKKTSLLDLLFFAGGIQSSLVIGTL